MIRTAGAPIGCQRPSRFWGLGCPKIYHEAEDTLESPHGVFDEKTARSVSTVSLFRRPARRRPQRRHGLRSDFSRPTQRQRQ
ncbi:hypothetical protein [Thiolapillus sp.]|uniref:hypothetical protein n=1 Tax=Thiolapillus sp. TaxID=2017437 RepID=UPI0025FA7B0C|nr:hypothetical protein [Thiolapillus sp.]